MHRMCNIGEKLTENALKTPHKPAVIVCKKSRLSKKTKYFEMTFKELDEKSDSLAHNLNTKKIIKKNDKVLVMLKPGVNLYITFFALFKIGAIPVLIDPGMGKKRLLECIAEIEPEAIIAIPLAQMISLIFPKYFKNTKIRITDGKKYCWGGYSLKKLIGKEYKKITPEKTKINDTAAILFTTGSTGPAKGVVYEHGMFEKQIELLKNIFDINENDIDCATFPGFSILSVTMGMTAVIPDMNPTKPGKVNPENIIQPIKQKKCSFSFGSPALWDNVSKYAEEKNITLPTIKKIVMAGAPVKNNIHKRLINKIIPNEAKTYTPYGATEAMPVACITGNEIINETAALTEKGKGVCVGRVVEDTEVKIIAINDLPIENIQDVEILPNNTIGEIIVRGRQVTKNYYKQKNADSLAKIVDSDNNIWHRMGDVGYKDEKNRIWFCGRKNHRVETENQTLFTICCESIINQQKNVQKSALVSVKKNNENIPVIIIEVKKGISEKEKNDVEKQIKNVIEKNEKLKEIKHILFYKNLPTDIRHNAKIAREKLAVWAKKNIT